MAALPRALAEKLPPGLSSRLLFRGAAGDEAEVSGAAGARAELGARVLSSGLKVVDELLPDGGFPSASVVELMVRGGAALGTTLALSTCRAVQDDARRGFAQVHEGRHGGPAVLAGGEGSLAGGEVPWCAFLDPSETLHAPGVARAGVTLERLLVVRPPVESLERVALRLVESQAFAVVVIDTVGAPGRVLSGLSYGQWPRLVRRFALALEGTETLVLLLTDARVRRALPLPVALRIELARSRERALSLRVAKERRGRVSSPHTVAWTRPARPQGTGPWDAGASDVGASDAGASDVGASDAGASDAGASDAGPWDGSDSERKPGQHVRLLA